MCNQSLFPIWQKDTSLDYRSIFSELSDWVHHMINCTSIKNPSIIFISMLINNLSRKDGMREIEWNLIGITWKFRRTRRWSGNRRWWLWNGRGCFHDRSNLMTSLCTIAWSKSHISLQKVEELLTLGLRKRALRQGSLWTNLWMRTPKSMTKKILWSRNHVRLSIDMR